MKAFVIEERHLSDASLEAAVLEVSNQAHLELTHKAVDVSLVIGRGDSLFSYAFTVDRGYKLSKSLGDLDVAPNGDVPYDLSLVEKMRTVLEFVDGNTYLSPLYGDDSSNTEYGISFQSRILVKHWPNPRQRSQA